MDDDTETYIMLLLSDSNLPTGSFVASSGLESYLTHGFPGDSRSKTESIATFIEDSIHTYAHSSLAFVSDAYSVVNTAKSLDGAIEKLKGLDTLYDAMTLHHVARRASKSQGVALLTLYSKGFTLPALPGLRTLTESEKDRLALVDRFKLLIRREECHGHLAVCWGVLTASLGLSLERAQYLHLFLHARSLLSAAVRLNIVGPYTSQQILLHVVRPLVLSSLNLCKDVRTDVINEVPPDMDGPVNTWPLGEILAARHDLQHSRIFNS